MSYWDMGGYAAFVWPAYGISLIALVTLGIVSWRAMKRAERLAELSERDAKSPDRV
jgi:heme exporter protein D